MKLLPALAPLAAVLSFPSVGSAEAMRCAMPEAAPGVADLHVDLPFQVGYRGRPADLSIRSDGSIDSQSLAAGCVGLLVLSVYVPEALVPRPSSLSELERALSTAQEIVRANGFAVGMHAQGQALRAFFGIEGAEPLSGHEERLSQLVREGVVLYGLVHAWRNALAGSSTDPRPGPQGLTPAGERFVRSVYEAGGLVDLSHASDEAFDDTARIARSCGRPLVATHSNARSIAGHGRNLTDDQLRAIASSGGVVGLSFHEPHLRDDRGRATAQDVALHARHMIDVMGSEHVAIGSDLDGLIRTAQGLESHAGVPALVEALRGEGLGPQEIRSVLYDNAARVLSSTGSPAVCAPDPSAP